MHSGTNRRQDHLPKFKLSTGIGKDSGINDFIHGVVVGVRWAALEQPSLKFTWSRKEKISLE